MVALRLYRWWTVNWSRWTPYGGGWYVKLGPVTFVSYHGLEADPEAGDGKHGYRTWELCALNGEPFWRREFLK